MPSQHQDTNLSDIKWDELSDEQLIDIRENDDRDTAKAKAATLFEERRQVNLQPITEYDPRKDPGPKRVEDEEAEEADDTPLSAEEVPLEESRKNESTLLSTDTVRVDDDGVVVIVP